MPRLVCPWPLPLLLLLIAPSRAMPVLRDDKYPLTDPQRLADGSVRYRVAMVSDLDELSASPDEPDTWISYMYEGLLTLDAPGNAASVEWHRGCTTFRSHISHNGRGLELSELVSFDGRLLTVDDKTGYVYAIDGNGDLAPWVKIANGDGSRPDDGMKLEWATVKDSKLYVGGPGEEILSPDGRTVASYDRMWVKTVDRDGAVTHLDWKDNYLRLREAVGVTFPGYMTHESCVWSDVHQLWYFLPRKVSDKAYDRNAGELKGANLLMSATADFQRVQVVHVGDRIPDLGYSSFKFVPGTGDTIIAAIATQEVGDVTATFVTVFTVEGKIIYPHTRVSDLKFEGIEFV